MTLVDELNFRNDSVLASPFKKAMREQNEIIEITRCLPEHPEGYEGICECEVCLSYAADMS